MRHLTPFAASEESPLLSGGEELLLMVVRSKTCHPMREDDECCSKDALCTLLLLWATSTSLLVKAMYIPGAVASTCSRARLHEDARASMLTSPCPNQRGQLGYASWNHTATLTCTAALLCPTRLLVSHQTILSFKSLCEYMMEFIHCRRSKPS
jgi:hypothetical protein